MHCGQSPPPSSMASIISGALGFCGMFRQVDFSHIRRQGNKPAHLLAKHAKCIVDYVAWIEETPCFLMQALTHDVSISIWVIIKLQSSYPKKKRIKHFTYFCQPALSLIYYKPPFLYSHTKRPSIDATHLSHPSEPSTIINVDPTNHHHWISKGKKSGSMGQEVATFQERKKVGRWGLGAVLKTEPDQPV